MTAEHVVRTLASAIDEHRWHDLPALLHLDFRCHLVHTGEEFDRDAWVRFNSDYPGFQRFVLQDLVASHDRAASRAHVTGLVGDELQHFEVAGFVTVRDGLIVELTEVWTDVDSTPPAGSPGRAVRP